ncbi:MAG: phosphodiester glycosidase family protein [Acidobacteria bacterium]|nr:phosphodiester glycosidase family protein [Acidobacteriota bacterium]
MAPASEVAGRQRPSFVCLEMDPREVRPALSVQAAWNRSLGLIRGCEENGSLIEDHIREELDDKGCLRDAGRRIFGAHPIRRQVWTLGQHLRAWLAVHPGRQVAAWVGNGNLLANPWFVAYVQGALYALRDEPVAERTYTCLVVRHTGMVTIEPLRFAGPADPAIECATFGQRIVAGGVPITREQLIAMAREGQFSDLRHLFLFPRVAQGPERWIDPGLPAFRNPQVLEDALRGKPISADVSAFPEEAVRAGMAAKGYTDYQLGGGVLTFVPRAGIYPHNMIGIRADGALISVAVRGLSNRCGITILEAGTLMHRLGCRDALILDNGSDVTMAVRGRQLVANARERFRSLLLFHHAAGCEPVLRVEHHG